MTEQPEKQIAAEFIREKALYVLDQEAAENGDYGALDDAVERFIGRYPQDPDIQFYKAEKLWREGKNEQALCTYQQVLGTSENDVIKKRCLSVLKKEKQTDNNELAYP